MSTDSRLIQPAALVRRILFFVLLVAMTLLQLFVNFKGLNSADGIELAQLSRQISRQDGFTTQVVRPITIAQAETSQAGQVNIDSFPDTMHAPLSPLFHAVLFRVIGANNFDTWAMTKNEKVYALDRIIAAISIGFFMIALCISYFLVARIFDSRIAGVMALLLLFCDLVWKFSLSGLPQMLMLTLMSAGLYFTYRAVESHSEGIRSMGALFVAALFFVLLALTNWLCIWIFAGFVIFSIAYFRPRGLVAGFATIILISGAFFNLYQNYVTTGSPFGTAFLTAYNSDKEAQDLFMRSLVLGDVEFDFRNLLINIVRTTLQQITDLVRFLGGIIVAPLFFLALLHPFKRKSIADFRWAVLLMWATATIGMTFFGVHGEVDPNQLHILFTPIMTAYGLALVAIFWARLGFKGRGSFVSQAHFIVVVFISTAPMVLSAVVLIKDFMRSSKDAQTLVGQNYPYLPEFLSSDINLLVPKYHSIVTDQPEAVAWYADRVAIMMPRNAKQFKKLEQIAEEQGMPISGILVTPSSHAQSPMISANTNNLRARFADLAPLVADGPISFGLLANPRTTLLLDNGDDEMDEIRQRYAVGTPGQISGRTPILGGGHMTFYRVNDEVLLRQATEEARKRLGKDSF